MVLRVQVGGTAWIGGPLVRRLDQPLSVDHWYAAWNDRLGYQKNWTQTFGEGRDAIGAPPPGEEMT